MEEGMNGEGEGRGKRGMGRGGGTVASPLAPRTIFLCLSLCESA